MLLIHTAYTRTWNPVTLFWFMCWNRAPDAIKRMFMLTSLYATLVEEEDISLEELDKFSRELEIEAHPKAMKFPALIGKWVWSQLLPFRKISLDNEEHYIHRLVKKIPCWLWYEDAESRRRDIQQLVDWLKLRGGSGAATA